MLFIFFSQCWDNPMSIREVKRRKQDAEDSLFSTSFFSDEIKLINIFESNSNMYVEMFKFFVSLVDISSISKENFDFIFDCFRDKKPQMRDFPTDFSFF